MTSTTRTTPAAMLVVAGVFACVAGLVVARTGNVMSWGRLADSIALSLLASCAAGACARGLRVPFASALAVVWLLALTGFSGLRPVGSVALLGAAAVAIGGLFVPRDRQASPIPALALGLVFIGGIAGWTLRWPIHHAWVHAPVLLAICVARRSALRDAWQCAREGWSRAVAADPRGAGLAVLLLGLVSIAAWLPTMQADDLAYHLGLPSQLLRWGFYTPDPTRQIWALAPWLGDVLQGIAQVVAAEEARGPLDVLWLGAAAGGSWLLARRVGADARAAWLAVALLASQPMLTWLLGGMQTELPTSALLVVLACVILDEGPYRLLAGAVLVAGLVALKFGSAVSALLLVGWALLRERGRLPWLRMPAAFALFVLLAGSSYLLAWRLSGNPLLPLFNDVFRSPVLAPVQLSDPRWHEGVGVKLLWRITFATGRYGESPDGSFGFTLVALAGAWALALWRQRTRSLALVASLVLLLPLLPLQYARYAFPGLVLLLPAMAVATADALGARAGGLLLCALCTLNVAFQPNANWIVRNGAVRSLVRAHGDPMPLFEHDVPERAIAARLRELDDGTSVVLLLDAYSPYLAELAGRDRTIAHYSPRLRAAALAADADASGARWQALIREIDARWIVLRQERLGAAQRQALTALDAKRVAAAGKVELWSVAAPAARSGR